MDHGLVRRPALPSRRTLWVVAAALAAIAVALGTALGVSLSGSGSHTATAFQDASVGISGRCPAAWAASTRGGGVAVVSPNHSAVVEVAAPAPASGAGALLADTLTTVAHDYHGVQMRSRATKLIDHLRASIVVLDARDASGTPVRILVGSAAGRHLAYLLEVFTTTTASPSTVVAAQDIVNSLRLTM